MTASSSRLYLVTLGSIVIASLVACAGNPKPDPKPVTLIPMLTQNKHLLFLADQAAQRRE